MSFPFFFHSWASIFIFLLCLCLSFHQVFISHVISFFLSLPLFLLHHSSIFITCLVPYFVFFHLCMSSVSSLPQFISIELFLLHSSSIPLPSTTRHLSSCVSPPYSLTKSNHLFFLSLLFSSSFICSFIFIVYLPVPPLTRLSLSLLFTLFPQFPFLFSLLYFPSHSLAFLSCFLCL